MSFIIAVVLIIILSCVFTGDEYTKASLRFDEEKRKITREEWIKEAMDLAVEDRCVALIKKRDPEFLAVVERARRELPEIPERLYFDSHKYWGRVVLMAQYGKIPHMFDPFGMKSWDIIGEKGRIAYENIGVSEVEKYSNDDLIKFYKWYEKELKSHGLDTELVHERIQIKYKKRDGMEAFDCDLNTGRITFRQAYDYKIDGKSCVLISKL